LMGFSYELLDFGDGRKLESLGGYIVDRPSPAALGYRKQTPVRWRDINATFDAAARRWRFHTPWPSDLSVDCGAFRMPLRPTPFGHIGLFPEQAGNWSWLASENGRTNGQPRTALNLFAYTGASTLALAAAGYRVAHVDAARPNVMAAREAAAANGWTSAPIRYLVDDAVKFVAKEIRRSHSYHTLVLDPPAYGHAPQGKAWRLERDLWPLLENCFRLVDPEDFRILITGHSPQVDQRQTEAWLRQFATPRGPKGRPGLHIQSGRSQLKDTVGRALDAGFYVRVTQG